MRERRVIYTIKIKREAVLKHLFKLLDHFIRFNYLFGLTLYFSNYINTLHNLELIYNSPIIYYIITLTINYHEYMTDYSNMFTKDVIITTYSFINSIIFLWFSYV